MKFETFEYVDSRTNKVKGYGCLIREKGKKNQILMPDKDDPYFSTKEEAKKAGREFKDQAKPLL